MSAKTLRRRCKHPRRTEIRTDQRVIRDFCPDCGATWQPQPSAAHNESRPQSED